MKKSDDKTKNTAGGKYIPPHKRSLQTSMASASISEKKNTLISDGKLPQPSQAVPLQKNIQASVATLSFTNHARDRQEQRDISNKTISDTIVGGVKTANTSSETYVTKDTVVVRSDNGKIITVRKNTANTHHNITNNYRQNEQELLEKIKSKKKTDVAMCELAELYLGGNLGTRNVVAARDLLLQAIKTNKRNSHAMCMLAELYALGDLGAPNLEKAKEYWKIAAGNNNRYGAYMCAQFALIDYVKNKNSLSSVSGANQALQGKIQKYLDQANSRGGNSSMWLQGYILEKGYFGTIDLEKSIAFYTKSANNGNVISIECLHQLFIKGIINSERFESILEKISKNIAVTDSGTAVEIGLQQAYGLLGNNKNRGVNMITKAAENNNVKAMYALAKCYREGIGCVVDMEKSNFWGQKAIELAKVAGQNGNISALWNLGHAYLSGVLGEINLNKARETFTNIANADNNNPFYKFALGRFYLEGVFGDINPEVGSDWILKAKKLWSIQADAGNLVAKTILDDINKEEKIESGETEQLVPIKALPDIYVEQQMDNIELKELICMLNRARGQIMRVNVNASFFSKVDIDNQIFDIDTILSPEVIFNMAIKIKDREPLLAAHYFRTAAKCDYKLAYIELAQLYKSGKLGQNVQLLHQLFEKRATRLESSDNLHEETLPLHAVASKELKNDTEVDFLLQAQASSIITISNNDDVDTDNSTTKIGHITMTNLNLATNINNAIDTIYSNNSSATSIAGNSSSSRSSTAAPRVSGYGGIFYSLPSFTGVTHNMSNLAQRVTQPLLHGFRSQQITMGFTQIANVGATSIVNVLQSLARDACSPDGTMRMR